MEHNIVQHLHNATLVSATLYSAIMNSVNSKNTTSDTEALK